MLVRMTARDEEMRRAVINKDYPLLVEVKQQPARNKKQLFLIQLKLCEDSTPNFEFSLSFPYRTDAGDSPGRLDDARGHEDERCRDEGVPFKCAGFQVRETSRLCHKNTIKKFSC